MKALITMREDVNAHGESVDVIEHNYIKFWKILMGINLIPVSNLCCVDEQISERIDAIILTGGGSVPSKFFISKENRHEQINRDMIEEKLLKCAINRRIPLVGICRGMQYINCLLGGRISTLNNLHPVGVEHNIYTQKGECYTVNSFHNDGIFCEQLSEVLVPIAYDESRTIVEAYRHKSNKIIGIQWHPERKMADKASVAYSLSLLQEILSK